MSESKTAINLIGLRQAISHTRHDLGAQIAVVDGREVLLSIDGEGDLREESLEDSTSRTYPNSGLIDITL